MLRLPLAQVRWHLDIELGFCMFEQDYGERIPRTLTGVGRFFLELEIKHRSKIPADINTNRLEGGGDLILAFSP